jgi:phosphoglycolate phosphatase
MCGYKPLAPCYSSVKASNVVSIRCQNQTFENIQAIIFDKDGTLANVESYLKSLGQKRARLVDAQVPGVQEPLLMAFGVEASHINPMGLLAIGSRRENEIAAAAYVAETGQDWFAALRIADSAFTEAAGYLEPKAKHTPLFPGIKDWLSHLSGAGLKLGILSADTSENIQRFLETHQLEDKIAAYHGVDGEIGKPDPRLYAAICHKLDVSPAHTLMVGDSTADMVMAKAGGCSGCIGVTWGWQTKVRIDRTDCAIAEPNELHVQ